MAASPRRSGHPRGRGWVLLYPGVTTFGWGLDSGWDGPEHPFSSHRLGSPPGVLFPVPIVVALAGLPLRAHTVVTDR